VSGGAGAAPQVSGAIASAIDALDGSGMFTHIRGVGAGLIRAWEASERIELAAPCLEATSIVVLGIGGSATAGEYFAALAAATSRLPVQVVQGPELPKWVGPQSLVAVCSYSGNTAETLAACEAASARGCMLVAVTSGGRLAALAAERKFPVFAIDYTAPPRATTVFTLAPLLRIGLRLGATAFDTPEVAEAAEAHARLVDSELAPGLPPHANRAAIIAASLVDRFPIVLSGGELAPAAVRFKNQLAENGKTLAGADFIPEAGHNLVVGLGTVDTARLAAIVLEPASGLPAMKASFAAVAGEIESAGVPLHRISIDGPTALARLLVATAWGDYVSCYLALLKGQDPTPIPQIERVRAYGS
jgi:glucose/mannose-6-phosphate isomerase